MRAVFFFGWRDRSCVVGVIRVQIAKAMVEGIIWHRPACARVVVLLRVTAKESELQLEVATDR